MSVEKKLKTSNFTAAAQEVGDVYIPKDLSGMSLTNMIGEVEYLREKSSQLSFCEILRRLEEMLSKFAASCDIEEQNKLIKLLTGASDAEKVAIQQAFSDLIKVIASGDNYQEELSNLTAKETLNNILAASNVKHLFGLLGIRMRVFRGDKILDPESDVPLLAVHNIVNLNNIKAITRKELYRYTIDDLLKETSDESVIERFQSVVHEELNEVATGWGRIETVHLTVAEKFATPWLKLWEKIKAAEKDFPCQESCPVCSDPCDDSSVLIASDGCDHKICLKCAVQSFGIGKEKKCPQCSEQVKYWTTNKEFNMLRHQMKN